MDIRLKVFFMERGDWPDDEARHGEHGYWAWWERPKVIMLLDRYDDVASLAWALLHCNEDEFNVGMDKEFCLNICANDDESVIEMQFSCQHDFEEFLEATSSKDTEIKHPHFTTKQLRMMHKTWLKYMRPLWGEKNVCRVRFDVWQDELWEPKFAAFMHSMKYTRVSQVMPECKYKEGWYDDTCTIEIQDTPYNISVFIDWIWQHFIIPG